MKNASEKGSAEVQIAAQMALARLEKSEPTPLATERVGITPPDDAWQRVSTLKGNAANGAGIFARQACLACHAVSMDQVQKGPYLGDAGGKFTPEYLLEAVLYPDKVVAQGFQSTWFTLNDGTTHEGFVTSTKGDIIELRNIAGLLTTINTKNVKEQGQRPQSMMPPALAATLTWQELADLIAYMESLK